MRRFVGRHMRLLLVLVGCALLAWLVARLGTATIVAALDEAGPRIAWLLAVYLTGTAMISLPWRWLLPREMRPGTVGAVVSRIAAAGVNAIDPMFGVSGEPCRLLWLHPADRLAGFAALLADRVLFWLATGIFLAITSGIVLATRVVPTAHGLVGLGLAAGWLALATVFRQLALGNGVVGPLARLVRRVLRRPPRPASARQLEVDAHLRTMLAYRRPQVVGLAVHLAGRMVLATEPLIALLVLDIRVDPAVAVYVAAVPSIIALIGSPVPGQIGVQEGGMVLAFTAAGLDPRVGLAVVTLQRVRQLFSISIGGAILALRRSDLAHRLPRNRG